MANQSSPLAATKPKIDPVMPAEMMKQIKRAVDEVDATTESFLFIGRKAAGKKTLALTIPGRKFIHCFDQNASSGLSGRKDVDYVEWLPKKLRLTVKSTPKGGADATPVANPPGPWGDFEKFHMRAQDTNFYQQYDVVGFISCTSMTDLLLDHIVAMQGRPGYVPVLGDYHLAGQGMANTLRSTLSENVMVFATANYSYEQDDETKNMINHPVIIGQQKSKIPNIFSNVWACNAQYDGKGEVVKYFIQTVEDKQTLNLGRSRRLVHLSARVEVTMTNPQANMNQGVAQFFAQAGIKIGGKKAQSD